jgi:LPS O-antigen subunit length determinant protein (WzzB/FepE family)
MNASVPAQDDEIDLLELITTVWDGRWFIVAVASVCVFFGGAIALLLPKTLSGEFDLRPIPSWSSQDYAGLNALEFFNVDRDRLFELFIEDVSNKGTLEAAIRQYSNNKRQIDETDLEYNDRLVTEAHGFQLLPPSNPENTRNRDPRRFWSMAVKSQEPEETIRLILGEALSNSQSNVRQVLQRSFEQFVYVQRNTLANRLEDIATERDNLFEDYDKQIDMRLSFLKEQAEIARTLGIAKNTLDAQVFQAGSALVSNVNIEPPFYLRGFEAIDKEIKLLQDRGRKDAFIGDLITVEQQARAIEQSKLIDRAVVAFGSTPLVTGDFRAASYAIATMGLKPNVRSVLIVLASAVIGGFIAMVVVLIRASLRRRSLTNAG